MTREKDDSKREPRRLRVPAVLVVALVGTAATAAVAVVGCDAGMPQPIDASSSGMQRIDGAIDAGEDAQNDAGLPPDAPADAPPDGPPHT